MAIFLILIPPLQNRKYKEVLALLGSNFGMIYMLKTKSPLIQRHFRIGKNICTNKYLLQNRIERWSVGNTSAKVLECFLSDVYSCFETKFQQKAKSLRSLSKKEQND